MKTKFLVFLSVLLLVIFTGCEEEDPANEVIVSANKPSPPTFKITNLATNTFTIVIDEPRQPILKYRFFFSHPNIVNFITEVNPTGTPTVDAANKTITYNITRAAPWGTSTRVGVCAAFYDSDTLHSAYSDIRWENYTP